MGNLNLIMVLNLDGKAYAKVSNLRNSSQTNIDTILENRIAKDSILCPNMNGRYAKYAVENDLIHLPIKSEKRVDGMFFSIQHINNYHSSLKDFMRPFHGVATKYLNNNLAMYAKGDSGFIESVWERHNACAIILIALLWIDRLSKPLKNVFYDMTRIL